MKRFLLTIVLLLVTTLCFAQQKTAKVVLKNGTSLTGTITEIDPLSHVTIVIAGIETKVEMKDVESIEDLAITGAALEKIATPIIEEKADFPSNYTIKVGPYEIKMVLVKGGTFSMGYDGSGSLAMNSEPVHDVTLSSFYINEAPLNKELVDYIKKGDEAKSASSSIYHPYGRKEANAVVERLAEITNLPLILITEAQWEYTAITQNGIFDFSKNETNYCFDYYEDYKKTPSPQVNPMGPPAGRYYVLRRASSSAQTLYRHFSTKDQGPTALSAIRFTMPTASILK